MEKLIVRNVEALTLRKHQPGRHWVPARIYLKVPSGNMSVNNAVINSKCPYLKALLRKEKGSVRHVAPGIFTI